MRRVGVECCNDAAAAALMMLTECNTTPEYGIEQGLEQLEHEIARPLFAQLNEHHGPYAAGRQQPPRLAGRRRGCSGGRHRAAGRVRWSGMGGDDGRTPCA